MSRDDDMMTERAGEEENSSHPERAIQTDDGMNKERARARDDSNRNERVIRRNDGNTSERVRKGEMTAIIPSESFRKTTAQRRSEPSTVTTTMP